MTDINQNQPVPTRVPAPLADEPTITMLFPKRTTLQLDDGCGAITFEAGVRQVPASLADHPWIKKNAHRHTRTAAEAKAFDQAKADYERTHSGKHAASVKAANDNVLAVEARGKAAVVAAQAKADADLDEAKSKVTEAEEAAQTPYRDYTGTYTPAPRPGDKVYCKCIDPNCRNQHYPHGD